MILRLERRAQRERKALLFSLIQQMAAIRRQLKRPTVQQLHGHLRFLLPLAQTVTFYRLMALAIPHGLLSQAAVAAEVLAVLPRRSNTMTLAFLAALRPLRGMIQSRRSELEHRLLLQAKLN